MNRKAKGTRNEHKSGDLLEAPRRKRSRRATRNPASHTPARKNASPRVNGRKAQKESGGSGMPELVFSSEDIETMQALRGQGRTHEEIADYMGISRTAYFEHKAKNPAIADTIDRGDLIALAEVAIALYREAIKGSLGHIQYLHRVLRMHPHAHAQKVEHTGKDGGPIESDQITRVLTNEEIGARVQVLIDRQESTPSQPQEEGEAA